MAVQRNKRYKSCQCAGAGLWEVVRVCVPFVLTQAPIIIEFTQLLFYTQIEWLMK